jgi:hypothetical protein
MPGLASAAASPAVDRSAFDQPFLSFTPGSPPFVNSTPAASRAACARAWLSVAMVRSSFSVIGVESNWEMATAQCLARCPLFKPAAIRAAPSLVNSK